MSAAPTAAALPYRPDPPSDPVPDCAPAPSRTGRLLGLLRKLIDYGKDLAHTLQQRSAATALFTVALQFGTRDFALILARITRGLQLANALEARLLSRPGREETAPALVRAPSDRPRRTGQPVAPRASKAASQLPDMPTAEEIAAALRQRPVGAVIADICRDLGILPSHPLWDEVAMVVTEYGGNYVKLFSDVLDRVCARFADPFGFTQDAWLEPWSQAAAVAVCGTGPP